MCKNTTGCSTKDVEKEVEEGVRCLRTCVENNTRAEFQRPIQIVLYVKYKTAWIFPRLKTKSETFTLKYPGLSSLASAVLKPRSSSLSTVIHA